MDKTDWKSIANQRGASEALIYNMESIIQCMEECGGVSVCSIIGSLAKNMYSDGESDIDLLILIDQVTSDEKLLRILDKKGFIFSKQDDIFVTKVDETNISLAIREENEFFAFFDSILDGCFPDCVIKDWAIGGVIEEVMLRDIYSSITCFDKTFTLTKKKKSKLNDLSRYEAKMQSTLKLQFENKANLAIRQFKHKKYFLFYFAFFEAIVIYSRIYCLDNSILHPSLKHIISKNSFANFQKTISFNNLSSFSLDAASCMESLEKIRKEVIYEPIGVL